MSAVVRHVCDAISPISRACADAARAKVAPAGAPLLERLAAALAGAQHAPVPKVARRTIVVAIGDHGAGDPGVAMGADHPTVIAAHAIADGTAALAHVARTGRAPVLLVDAGAREAARLPAGAVRLGRGPTRDLLAEPAMTVVDAVLGLEAGIALAVSLSESGLDVVAVGAIGVGSELASAALLGAATGRAPAGLDDAGADVAGARGAAMANAGALERLAAFGGAETALLAGLMLGAASMNIPTVLDGYATGAAALAAASLAPELPGYLIAAHRGSFTHPAITAHLRLETIFEVGIGHGEGTGAAMLLPLLDQVAALADR